MTCIRVDMNWYDIHTGWNGLIWLAVKNSLLCVHLKDIDGDHRVSYKDFQEAIKLENLLLQGFGQCLPDDKVGDVECYDCRDCSDYTELSMSVCVCVCLCVCVWRFC